MPVRILNDEEQAPVSSRINAVRRQSLSGLTDLKKAPGKEKLKTIFLLRTLSDLYLAFFYCLFPRVITKRCQLSENKHLDLYACS